MRSSTSYLLRRTFAVITLALLIATGVVVTQLDALEPQIEAARVVVQAPRQQPAVESVDRETSRPYTGNLSIFEDPRRDQRLQIDRVMDLLGIKQGVSVADIGAGSGWFTVRAARRVGNSATVYAVDINSNYLKHIEERARGANLPNIRTILGKEDDPLLPAKSVDAVLLLKTYHEIAEPIRLLVRAREAMRPGGLLGIIDRNGRGDNHGIDRGVVVDEAARAGFVLIEEHDFVRPDNMDYFLIFRAR